MIISVVVPIFTLGYSFSVTKNTIEKNDNVPRFQAVVNLVNGIKIGIVEFALFIILSIISLIILSIPFITTPSLSSLLTQISQDLPNATSSDYLSTNVLPLLSSYISTHISVLLIMCCTILIVFVLYLILLFISIIGLGMFAETGELTSFFKFKEIFKKISAIGKLKFLGVFIVTSLISLIIFFIFSIIGLIKIGPIQIGTILVIIESPYLLFFTSRIYGLLYNESEIKADKDVSYDITE
jgi:hypothetical protein